MHLIEAYALTSGCKISKPYIWLEEIVLPKNKYITFHGFSPTAPSKQYNKWEVVLDLLKNDNEFNYDIIQIGQLLDTRYKNANHEYLGRTNYHSLAYLIKNCSLHLGFDSLPIHLASFFQKKIVGIYPWYAKNCGPYFSNEQDVKIIEPDFTLIKPCFNVVDEFDLINKISPFDIYNSVKKLLKEK